MSEKKKSEPINFVFGDNFLGLQGEFTQVDVGLVCGLRACTGILLGLFLYTVICFIVEIPKPEPFAKLTPGPVVIISIFAGLMFLSLPTMKIGGWSLILPVANFCAIVLGVALIITLSVGWGVSNKKEQPVYYYNNIANDPKYPCYWCAQDANVAPNCAQILGFCPGAPNQVSLNMLEPPMFFFFMFYVTIGLLVLNCVSLFSVLFILPTSEGRGAVSVAKAKYRSSRLASKTLSQDAE